MQDVRVTDDASEAQHKGAFYASTNAHVNKRRPQYTWSNGRGHMADDDAEKMRRAEPSCTVPSIPVNLSNTEVATQDTQLKPHNKGYQMCIRKGWIPGTGLGKMGWHGIVTPLKFQVLPVGQGLRITTGSLHMKAEYSNFVDRSANANYSDSWGEEKKADAMQLQNASEALKCDLGLEWDQIYADSEDDPSPRGPPSPYAKARSRSPRAPLKTQKVEETQEFCVTYPRPRLESDHMVMSLANLLFPAAQEESHDDVAGGLAGMLGLNFSAPPEVTKPAKKEPQLKFV
jgi:hypothetical protein